MTSLMPLKTISATIFYSVPALYEVLSDYHRTDRVNWKKIKVLVSGADALLEDTSRGWEQRTGVKIHEGWGMTETTSVGIVSPYGKPKTGSFGVPMSSCVAAIADPASDDFLPVGETGELALQRVLK